MKKLLILIIIAIGCSLFANYKDMPVTRDLEPNAQYDTYQDWLADHPQQQTHFNEVSRVSSNQREEGFLIVVNDNLYEDIEQSIQIYQEDLANESFDSFVLEYDGTSHEDLKEQIIIYTQVEDVTNVVLIGDLPVAWFELFEDWNNNGIQDNGEEWVEFPCDLYFTDIDGIWDDADVNGIYDYHEGDKHPEIGIGRIVADNMSMLPASEAELINDYFQKNHLFRSGIITSYETSLAYIDDDWSYWGTEYQQAMQLAYPSVELVNDIEETNAGDYRDNRLIADYEFIQVHVHSGPNAHYFYYNNGNNYALVNNYEIPDVNPTAHYYNLFACSNSRFTTSNNMGAMYIYGSDHGLATLGSTKTGSMLWFEDFYEPFGLDETLGEALRQWWEVTVDVGDDLMWQRAWFYGMIIQGDPSLKRAYEDNVVYVPDNYPTIQEAINAVEDGDIVLVNPGTYVENINFNGKNITVASLYYTTQDTSYISQTIIDGNQNGSVVTFESGEDSTAVLCGFTIMNGMKTIISSGGGGICILNSNPHLHNLIISANFATSGAGIYIHNASPIINNMIIINNVVPVSGFGGGLYLMNCDNMILKNLSIIHNETEAYGSGLFISGCESLIFENLIVSNNECGGFGGGALYFQSSDAIILNSTICYNNNQYSGGGLIGGENVHLVNSIVYGNSEPQLEIEHSADYCLIQGGFPGTGNIDADPLFVNPVAGDFHLQDSSLCIGAGIEEIEINGTWYFAPEFDIEGTIRPAPVGSNPDIGAYENLNGEPYVSAENNQLIKPDYQLQNYPNPFNPSTTISFSVTQTSSFVNLEIYNLKGQKVKEFTIPHSSSLIPHQIIWDGSDSNNKPVSSGIYFYKLIVDNKSVANKKMLLIK